MKRFIKPVFWTGAVILGGAVLTFLLYGRTDDLLLAGIIGFFYAAMLATAFWLVYRFWGRKLQVFPGVQQWILRALMYVVALGFAYLSGLIFQTLLLHPLADLREALVENFWTAFIYFVTLPGGEQPVGEILTAEFRDFVLTFLAFMLLIGSVGAMASFVEIRWREARHRAAREKAELTALRARIEPHFLFNSLNTIAALISRDARKAEDLLLQLSDLLRHVFQNSSEEMIPVEREIAFARQYANLLQARFGAELRIDWRISLSRTDIPVPVFLLQPLIENAVRHGWRRDEDNGLAIEIRLSESPDHLQIFVADDGRGIAPETLRRLPKAGHALANIAERLTLHFQQDNLLKIESTPGSGTRIYIVVPVSNSIASKEFRREDQ